MQYNKIYNYNFCIPKFKNYKLLMKFNDIKCCTIQFCSQNTN